MPLPSFDPTKPIPPFFSRHPHKTPSELEHLLQRSKSAIRAGKTTLRQASNLASLVNDEESWIKKFSAGRSSSSANRRPAGATGTIGATGMATIPVFSDGTTGGHCNTNHIMPWVMNADGTPDKDSNRARELMRNYSNRQRLEQPESRTEDRWNKPRVPGERRRRIFRDKDAPEAPPEPPPSGYIIFVTLMTTKYRHDRGPEATHSQTAVVQEISRIWRNELKTSDQEYYNTMSENIRREYQQQMIEFRATDTFRPSEQYTRLGGGQGPWMHKLDRDRNELEKEIASYETVVFPPRPPSQDQAYHEREEISKIRRKEKMRQENEERKVRKRALEETLHTRKAAKGESQLNESSNEIKYPDSSKDS